MAGYQGQTFAKSNCNEKYHQPKAIAQRYYRPKAIEEKHYEKHNQPNAIAMKILPTKSNIKNKHYLI